MMQYHGKKMGGGKKMLMKDGAPEMSESHEGTTLDKNDYPELEGMTEGSPISGKWSGKITAVNGDKYTITYDEVNLETENSADREYDRMSRQPQIDMSSGDEG